MLMKWERVAFLRTRSLLVERGGAEESRRVFFEMVSLLLPKWDPRYQEIKKAYNYAEVALEGQMRESGERSFSHSWVVAIRILSRLRMKDHHLIIAALLHDVPEDCPEKWTVALVRQEFGDYVAMLNKCGTKLPRRKFASREFRDRAYRLQHRFAPRDFFEVKLEDRLHNIQTLGACSRAKQIRQIEETRRYYLPYAKKYNILVRELEEALSQAEARLRW